MNLTIYHGSDHIISQPIYGAGKIYNDYGLGFYCTENADVAKEWAVKKQKDGYLNRYEIDLSDLKVLRLNSEEYNILHWLTILLQNRNFDVQSPLANEAKKYLTTEFHINTDEYDIIIGYRADDSYFSFSKDFINGVISLRQLKYAMQLGKSGEQFVLKSKYAFEKISFMGYENVAAAEWYPKLKLRDDNARKKYFNLDKNKYIRGDIYITRILDEEMKADDTRLW